MHYSGPSYTEISYCHKMLLSKMIFFRVHSERLKVKHKQYWIGLIRLCCNNNYRELRGLQGRDSFLNHVTPAVRSAMFDLKWWLRTLLSFQVVALPAPPETLGFTPQLQCLNPVTSTSHLVWLAAKEVAMDPFHLPRSEMKVSEC